METDYVDDPDRNRSKRAPPSIPTQFDAEIEKILDHRVVGTIWEKPKDLWQFDDQIEDYLKTVSMRTSSSSGVGVQLCNYELVTNKRIQGAWVLARQLGCTKLMCGQSRRQDKAVCWLDKARLWT
ncbi:hypothetical protein KY285_020349 [Solanum tuberosum]|nr:hypothetical protein KY285_020349 [Solanum tuberosum]